MHLHDVCDIITSNVGAVLPVVALSILVNHKKKTPNQTVLSND